MTDKNFLLFEMIHAAIHASRKIMDIYSGEYDISFKDDASPLTTADIASNEIITSRLREKFPDCSILSEEESDSTDRLTNENGVFILDPLDGTKEFVNRNGEFCVSLAFARNKRVICGVIAVPAKEWIYYACVGEGAYKTDFDGISENFRIGDGKRLHVSDRWEKVTAVVSRSHMDEQTKRLLQRNQRRIGEIITVGSCLKGCYIAEGRADIHYRFGEFTKEWDTAAMQVICEESGAIFTDIYGDVLSANRADPVNRRGFRILNRPESELAVCGIV